MATTTRTYEDQEEYVAARELDRLRAQLAQMLEIMGLEAEQERAAVKLMKALTYETQSKLLAGLRL